jgi:hypothetical protein
MGVGLTARSWSIALGIVTLGLVLLAGTRRAASPTGAVVRRERQAGYLLRPAGVLAAGAVVILAVLAVLIARLPASSAHVRGYSVLWALPGKQTGNVLAFTVGVRSDELQATRYRLVGREGGRVVLSRTFVLPPRGEWRGAGQIRLSITPFAFPQPLRLSLYRGASRGRPYRQVFLSPGSTA